MFRPNLSALSVPLLLVTAAGAWPPPPAGAAPPQQGSPASAPRLAHTAPAAQPGQMTLESYAFTTFDGVSHAAQRGTLWVPENHQSSRSSRLIQLAFVRLRSTANAPGPPLVFLAGGPGAPGIGMGRVPIYFRLFERLREVGDVILLDQRGTGLSSPNLSFPATTSAPRDIFESEANWLRELTRQARASTDYWRSRGVDLSAYNSAQSADDLEDLRRALGAQKINLLGHSYGTELALAAVRRHPDRLDRLVFAGVHGPDDQQSLASVWDFLIRKLAVLAAADAQVGKDVPDLEGLFRRVLAKLERTPVTLTVTDERAKRPVRIRVGKIGLQWLVRMDMTDARTFARLPALLYAIDHGDYDAFARRMEPLYNAGLSRSAMAWAVDLSTGWSPERRLRAQREAAGAMFSNVNLQWTDEIRRIVGVADRGRELRARVWSTLPALFVSGTLDPNTPPFQAEEVRWGFPNSAHLIVENGGHESLLDEKVQEVILEFLRTKDVGAVRGRSVYAPPPRFVPVGEVSKAETKTR